jgi:hypothetical protein
LEQDPALSVAVCSGRGGGVTIDRHGYEENGEPHNCRENPVDISGDAAYGQSSGLQA